MSKTINVLVSTRFCYEAVVAGLEALPREFAEVAVCLLGECLDMSARELYHNHAWRYVEAVDPASWQAFAAQACDALILSVHHSPNGQDVAGLVLQAATSPVILFGSQSAIHVFARNIYPENRAKVIACCVMATSMVGLVKENMGIAIYGNPSYGLVLAEAATNLAWVQSLQPAGIPITLLITPVSYQVDALAAAAEQLPSNARIILRVHPWPTRHFEYVAHPRLISGSMLRQRSLASLITAADYLLCWCIPANDWMHLAQISGKQWTSLFSGDADLDRHKNNQRGQAFKSYHGGAHTRFAQQLEVLLATAVAV